MDYLLGIDIGTSGTKSIVIDTEGKVLATATCEHDIVSPRAGWSEQDPRLVRASACDEASYGTTSDQPIRPAKLNNPWEDPAD